MYLLSIKQENSILSFNESGRNHNVAQGTNLNVAGKSNLNTAGKGNFDMILKHSLLFKHENEFKNVKGRCINSQNRVFQFGADFTNDCASEIKVNGKLKNKKGSISKLNSVNKVVEFTEEEISVSRQNNVQLSQFTYGKCVPERILDAPNMKDDFSINILDWGSNNCIAVALENTVYLWNGNTNETQLLSNCPFLVSSVKWLVNCTCLAIGMSNGIIQVWDSLKGIQLRNLKGHKINARVTALESNNFILFSGSADGVILSHDMRKKDHIVQVLKAEQNEEITSIKLSPHESNYLATSSKDGTILIWDLSKIAGSTLGNIQCLLRIKEELLTLQIDYTVDVVFPKSLLTQHKNGVRAISFCPWQKGLLVSGGVDKQLKSFNIEKGILISKSNLGSHIYSINWNIFDKEIVTTHGLPKNQISIWKFPEMIEVGSIIEHIRRPLYSDLSPDFTTLVTGSGEERLFFWKIFSPNSNSSKNAQNAISACPQSGNFLDELR